MYKTLAHVTVNADFAVHTILDFKMDSRLNHHTSVHLKGIIESNQLENISNMNPYSKITISADGELIFNGVIEMINVSHVADYYEFELLSYSNSILYDLVKRKYSFQNISMSYTELFNEINRNFSNGLINNFINEASTTGRLLIQYEETDWEFLMRLASFFNKPIAPSDLLNCPAIGFGIPGTHYDMDLFNIEHSVTNNENGMIITVDNHVYMNVGSYINFNGNKMRIVSRVSFIENSLLIHKYGIKNEADIFYKHYDNYNITGVSLHGYVEKTKNYRVKIRLDIDGKNGEYWFKYATPYSSGGNGGWYAMPEIDDGIRVSVPDFDHNSYAIGAVNDVESTFRQNPDIKRFRTRFGKDIVIAPEYIHIDSGSGHEIKLLDDGGIEILSASDILLKSDKNIELSAAKDITINAKEGISLEQGKNYIAVKDDIKILGKHVYME